MFIVIILIILIVAVIMVLVLEREYRARVLGRDKCLYLQSYPTFIPVPLQLRLNV